MFAIAFVDALNEVPSDIRARLEAMLKMSSPKAAFGGRLSAAQLAQRAGLASADWAAWRAMEAIHVSDRVRMLGISNVSLDQLQCLCERARIRPRFVQNRCYAATAWDRRVREFCAAGDITYQGFSLLTAHLSLQRGVVPLARASPQWERVE